ncbi:MAG: hypothetical protein ACI93T_002039 [Porticoccaceae bacterium]|jgi:hypothetical protein
MPLLDAVLAFAVTMLLVATVVTKCVDFLQWVLQKAPSILTAFFYDRVGLFEDMLNDFLKKELQAIAEIEFGDKANAKAKGFKLKTLTTILSQPTPGGQKRSQLSNVDMIDKLKQTELGKQLRQHAGERATEVFDEISRRYTAVEKDYSALFRRNTRKVATVVAFVVALAFNIDSFNIMGLYVDNPTLSAAVAAKSEQAMADYTAQLEEVDPAGTNKDVLQELKDQQAELQASLDELSAGEIPFGWSFFPFGSEPPQYWSHTDRESKDPNCRLYVQWFIGILFTAGLGSPFWYDVIRNVSQFAKGGSSAATERQKK